MGSTGLFLTAGRRWAASFCDASPAPHTDKNTVSECCFPVNLGAPRWERYSLSATSRDYSARLRSHPVVPYNWIWRCTICLCWGDVQSFSCCAVVVSINKPDVLAHHHICSMLTYRLDVLSACTHCTHTETWCSSLTLWCHQTGPTWGGLLLSAWERSCCSSAAVSHQWGKPQSLRLFIIFGNPELC